MSVKLNKSITKIVEAYFGKDAALRDEIATITSTKNLKKAVKAEATSYVNSIVDIYPDYLQAHLINIASTRTKYLDGITTEEFEAPLTKPEPLADAKTASKAMLDEHSHLWAVYNIKEALILLEIKEDVISTLEKGGKKLLSKLVQLFLSKYAVYKRDNVLINTVVNSTGHTLNTTTDEVAFSVISLIGGTGLFKRDTITGTDGGQDTVLIFNDTKYGYLKDIASRVDGMFPELFVTKITKPIVKRTKAAYEQSYEPLADVVDYLQSIGVSLIDGDVEGMALEATRTMIKDEDGDSVIDKKWKVRLSEINHEAYRTVDTFGMYDKYGTDGVGRIYSEGRISIQHKATHNHLQFTNKKALNSIGRKYTKLFIVDKAGYKVDGVKPTEEQALAYFYENEEQLAAAYSELYAMLKSRKHTGFIMEVDAQTQGPSIYGITGLHFNLLNGTGLIGDTYRTDYYLAAARFMNKVIGELLGKTVEIFDRNSVKSALMTKGYGAGYRTIMFGDGEVDSDTGDFTVKAKSMKQVPLMQTAEEHGITDTKLIWTAFQRAMKSLLPEVMEMQARLESLAETHKSHITQCTMPDDVEVSIIDQKMDKRVVKWIGSDMKVHQVTHSRMVPDPANTKSLAPRFIQAIDAYILRLVVRYMKEKGLQIQVNHDGYFVHPNDVEEVQKAYREAVLDVMKRDLLTDMVRQVFGAKVPSFQAKRIRMGREVISEEYLYMLVSNSKYSLWV